ncbi:MAG: RNA polymerase sigma factor [Phycisphaerales bacterium]|nr:MAG: RNA polymerase sigma factor [Phycisphaerales bacterium]
MRRISERQKLKGVRQGQREACEEVVCQHYRSIYRFMAYMSGDAGLAEDLTQETFTAAWANIGSYKGRASIGTWLHKIAYHKFIDSGRRLERRAALVAGLQKENSSEQEAFNPLHRLTMNEHWRILYEAMRKLEAPEYTSIVLHYIQDLSFREMGKVLDEPVGTVKWRTSRALARLKGFLTGRIEQ